MFASALTGVRMDALVALAEADPDDKTEILRLQAVVRVTANIRDALMAEILRTGEHDGGMTA